MNIENKERYKLSDLDELMEYMWIKPQISKLNVDIFVDDGGSYERNEHTLLLFVRNGHGRSVSEFIPISISENPYIMDDEKVLKISSEDIFAVKSFIKLNMGLLISMAQSKISHEVFVSQLKEVSSEQKQD
ncbi:MAG: hypothetical protein MJZ32_02730 [Bacteroidaceae bacterium]|nr:hypothetical protein [Bacteroidaceae bacterium]